MELIPYLRKELNENTYIITQFFINHIVFVLNFKCFCKYHLIYLSHY